MARKPKLNPKAMTVAKLIAALQKMPQNKLVEIAGEPDQIYVESVGLQGNVVCLELGDEVID